VLILLKKYFTYLSVSLGICFAILLLFAFTTVPYDIQVWLGTHEADYTFEPDYIVCLGGSGMPSADNLMRLYCTAELSKKHPQALVVIAHPLDSSVIQLMKNELLLRGVAANRIMLERRGTSTREQALKIREGFIIDNSKVLLVTSPEYMLRSVKTFRKAGFPFIGGEASFENAMYVDLSYNHKAVGGKMYTPDVSNNYALRYNFWSYFKLEISCLREFFALAYYKLNGWI
jgi:uncharacterized SAM-binding protein YcdF (DUF218 family)